MGWELVGILENGLVTLAVSNGLEKIRFCVGYEEGAVLVVAAGGDTLLV